MLNSQLTGFTRWGGKNNENPNFLRDESRKRVYKDIPNGPANELKVR
jgi:hypothetical protein